MARKSSEEWQLEEPNDNGAANGGATDRGAHPEFTRRSRLQGNSHAQGAPRVPARGLAEDWQAAIDVVSFQESSSGVPAGTGYQGAPRAAGYTGSLQSPATVPDRRQGAPPGAGWGASAGDADAVRASSAHYDSAGAPEQTVSDLGRPTTQWRELTTVEAGHIRSMRASIQRKLVDPETGPQFAQKSLTEQFDLVFEEFNQTALDNDRVRARADFRELAAAYLFGWGPLHHLLRDDVTEVMVNGQRSIYVERDGRLEPAGPGLPNAEIHRIVEFMIGIVPSAGRPIIDDLLQDGSRVNAVHTSLNKGGTTLCIRRFPIPLDAADLVRNEMITPQALTFLEMAVRGRLNIIISGQTNSGKTTLLNVILKAVPLDERPIIIEQSPPEIRCLHPNHVHHFTRPASNEGSAEITVDDLAHNALRERPERIIIGECRGGEAWAMLKAMNTGHYGSITTLHANDPLDALARLEDMVLEAQSGLPHSAISRHIARAVQIVVQTERSLSGKRIISQIVQVTQSADSITGYGQAVLFEARPHLERTSTPVDERLLKRMQEKGVAVEDPLLRPVNAPHV